MLGGEQAYNVGDDAGKEQALLVFVWALLVCYQLRCLAALAGAVTYHDDSHAHATDVRKGISLLTRCREVATRPLFAV